jgi:hypothetical protein
MQQTPHSKEPSPLEAKLGEVVEAPLQVAPNRSEAYFVLMLLCANVALR